MTTTDDAMCDLIDRVQLAMEAGYRFYSDACEHWWTPSEVGRKAKVSTDDARRALHTMVEHRVARSAGNGAWTKYALGR